MTTERIFLDKSDDRVWIDLYLHGDGATRPAMLVIPGGGYGMVCHDREGEPVARAFFSRGYNAFVLNYRVARDTDRYPAQLLDASRAVLYIRTNAARLSVDPERVYATGFSAGGHLAGSLAILHSDPDVLAELGIEKGANRPNACVLCYPVVSCLTETHGESFENLLGCSAYDIAAEQRSAVSLECNVGPDSAPLFIWHTAEDEAVPPDGSILLTRAYVRHGLPVTFQLSPYGPHGVALANEETCANNPDFVQPIADGWVDYAVKWLDTLA